MVEGTPWPYTLMQDRNTKPVSHACKVSLSGGGDTSTLKPVSHACEVSFAIPISCAHEVSLSGGGDTSTLKPVSHARKVHARWVCHSHFACMQGRFSIPISQACEMSVDEMLPLWCPKPKWWTFGEIVPNIRPKLTSCAREMGMLNLSHMHMRWVSVVEGTLQPSNLSHMHARWVLPYPSRMHARWVSVVEGTLQPSNLSRMHARWEMPKLPHVHMRWVSVVEGTLKLTLHAREMEMLNLSCMHARCTWGEFAIPILRAREVSLSDGGDTTTLKPVSHAREVSFAIPISWACKVSLSSRGDTSTLKPVSHAREVHTRWVCHSHLMCTRGRFCFPISHARKMSVDEMLPLRCPKPKWWTFGEIVPYIGPKLTSRACEMGMLNLSRVHARYEPPSEILHSLIFKSIVGQWFICGELTTQVLIYN